MDSDDGIDKRYVFGLVTRIGNNIERLIHYKYESENKSVTSIETETETVQLFLGKTLEERAVIPCLSGMPSVSRE